MEKRKLKLFVCTLAMGLIAGITNADIETGLQGYWPFEEGGGTYTEDVSDSRHNGTLINGAFRDNGPAGCGGSLSFNPTNRNHVECGNFNPASAEDHLTIALWVLLLKEPDKSVYSGSIYNIAIPDSRERRQERKVEMA